MQLKLLNYQNRRSKSLP